MAARVPVRDVLDRWLSAIAGPHLRPWLWAALAIGVGILALALLPRSRRRERWVTAVLTAGLVGFALHRAWQLAWVADDAFISFRYADHLVRGHGLVWNPGERIEGYTNFLWTLLAAGAIALGLSPVAVALVVSMLSFAGVLVLVTRLVALLAPKSAPLTPSIAAVALGLSYVMGSYATSGLETMTAACLVLLSLERAMSGRPLAAGVAGTCAAMLHPDHLIFFVALGYALLFERRRRALLSRFLLPFALLFVPWFLWRLAYYGDLHPNTYYAKSGDLRYFSQGRVYLWVHLFATGVVATLPFAAIGFVQSLKTVFGRFCWLALPLYLLWIAKIGGDFMLGRLLVVVLPIVLVLAEVSVRQAIVARHRYKPVALAGAGAVLIAALPIRLLEPTEKKWHIADERTFYVLASLWPLEVKSIYFEHGESFARVFGEHGLSPRYATGCVGMVGYLSRLPILDTLGLNDRTIARRPLGKRGRPGHERKPTAGDVVPRGVDFSDEQHFPSPYDRDNAFFVEGRRFHLMRFDSEFLDAVARDRRVRFTDIRNLIDGYDASAPLLTPERRACDLWFHSVYYFRHNRDPERRERFLSKLVAVDPSWRGLEGLLLGEPEPNDFTWEAIARESFDGARGRWHTEGDAFRQFPTEAQIPKQGTVGFASGTYVSSFDRSAEDGATGRAWTELPIDGDAITLRVGGGHEPDALRVSIAVDGRPLYSATGCRSELLGTRVWNVEGLRGRTATIEIVDQSRRGWGHLVIDELVQWRRHLLSAR